MSTFVHTSSHSHLTKSLNECPRWECKPTLKEHASQLSTVLKEKTLQLSPTLKDGIVSRNNACHVESCISVKAESHERLNRCDSVAGRLAWMTGAWATSVCVFKHSATMNQERVCSSLRERRQNEEILPNSSNYVFKRAILSPQLSTGCQILNMFEVNRWSNSTIQSPRLTAACSHERLHRRCSFSNGIAAIQSLV